MYDHSVERYLDTVGTVVSPDFETPIGLAVLTAFAQDVSSTSRRR